MLQADVLWGAMFSNDQSACAKLYRKDIDLFVLTQLGYFFVLECTFYEGEWQKHVQPKQITLVQYQM